MCLNAKATAAAESSGVPMPLMRISIGEGNIAGPIDAESSYFEYTPIVKDTFFHKHETNINYKQ